MNSERLLSEIFHREGFGNHDGWCTLSNRSSAVGLEDRTKGKKLAHILTCMYFATPVVVAFTNGSTYTFAFSVSGVGVLLYFTNIFLIRRFISTRAPELLDDWEATAGTGVVPRWVSEIGLAGLAFIPSGIVVASLLLLGFVPHH